MSRQSAHAQASFNGDAGRSLCGSVGWSEPRIDFVETDMTNGTGSSGAVFDFEGVFGDDYLHFYGPDLTHDRNQREAEVVWRLLSLQEGATVLDLGCGHGRIAVELAKRGGLLTGLDASAKFIGLAREAAAAAGLQINFIEGDMRRLPWQGEFDAIVIWFTTFGYFDDEDNEQVLGQAARALKPGGRLLIEQIHRNAVLHQDIPQHLVVQRGDDLMVDLVDYDVLAERATTERITVRNGHVRRTNYSIRLYGFAELARLLRAAGFQAVEGFGRDGVPLTTHSRRLLTLATKAGKDSPK